jgi:glycine reductase complex component B subunit alpha and beta
MRLELGTFPVVDARFGDATRWRDGHLEIDRAALERAARQDRRISSATVELAAPGEAVRIVRALDLIQPQVKVSGPGVAYPGVSGRSVETVGRGRTDRLGDLAVALCAPARGSDNAGATIDVGSVPHPYDRLHWLVVALEPEPELDELAWFQAVSGAGYRVADLLAEAVRGLDAPERELFDFDAPVDASLPRVVYVMSVNSAEHFVGVGPGLGGVGTAVYGLTRLHPPWLIHPLELLDGAVTTRTTWLQANNPVVLNLCRAHGRRFDVLGVIVQRTRWTSQEEKDLAAYQTAKLAKMLGADGAVITWDYFGNDFVEVVHTLRACEREGVKTVLMTVEYSGDDESAPPLIYSAPEADAIVSLGSLGWRPPGLAPTRPARVVGGPADLPPGPGLADARPTSELRAAGAYVAPLVNHFVAGLVDWYGFGRQSAFTS